ncbi:MAG TPA: alpha/beta fold hydrolase [Bryobacteraceae bacterium]|nr:alpha/beta fold hydrolase [Bryobacteraceae bacterium]
MKLALLSTAVLFATVPPHEAAADFALARWDALYGRFSPRMKATLTVDKLRELASAFGTCQPPTETPAARTARPGMDVYVFRLDCTRRAVGLSLTVDEQGVIQGMFFVEPPAAPAALAVVTGEYRLPAVLTMPKGDGPFAAVVLVHGSGPHDMDETIGPNKPFREIAEGLAARGIATLRYTKRTKQYGGRLPKTILLKEETVDDAVSAAALLRTLPKIDPKRVFVVGHSLGGYAAPRIGAADPQIAGLVLLAANVRSIGVLIDEQVKYLGAPPERAAELKNLMPAAYLQDLSTNPLPLAKTLAMPMYVLQGERDYQVTMEDFRRWRTMQGPRVKLRSYPTLNHLFQPGTERSTPAEYEKAVPFSLAVINDIADWIQAR